MRLPSIATRACAHPRGLKLEIAISPGFYCPAAGAPGLISRYIACPAYTPFRACIPQLLHVYRWDEDIVGLKVFWYTEAIRVRVYLYMMCGRKRFRIGKSKNVFVSGKFVEISS